MTPPTRHFGWAQTLATIVFCFALRFRSIEDFKNARRRDFGALIGADHGPSVLSLRTKIKALAESADPVALSRGLFQRYLAIEPVWEGLYYIDGHFCPYYGTHPTPRGWDAKRGVAVPGHTNVYIHDARGRALFFRSLLQLPGHVPATDAHHVDVHLQRPDSKKVARALDILLTVANQVEA